MNTVKVGPVIGYVLLIVEAGRQRLSLELEPEEATKIAAWLLQSAVLASQSPAASLDGLIGAIH